MTAIEIIDLARDLLNERLSTSRTFPDDSSSFFADTTLLGYLNREQQIVQNHLIQAGENFFVTSVTINISANVDEYTLNSSVLKILRMEWISADPLRPREIFPISFNEKEKLLNIDQNITGAGEVSVYAIKGNTLTFRPIPDSTLNSAVRYYFEKKLADLSAASSISEIPETYHEIMSLGIYKRALLQQEGSQESYAIAAKEYQEMINDLIIQAEDRQIQKPRFVKRNRYRRG